MSGYNIEKVTGGSVHVGDINNGSVDARTHFASITQVQGQVEQVRRELQRARADGLVDDQAAEEVAAALEVLEDESSAEEPRDAVMARMVKRIKRLTIGVTAAAGLTEAVNSLLRVSGLS